MVETAGEVPFAENPALGKVLLQQGSEVWQGTRQLLLLTMQSLTSE
jgi:hypothetical protein